MSMAKHSRYDLPRAGFRVREFCETTTLSRARVYQLIKGADIKYVKVGGRSVITTTPAEFLASAAQ